MSDPLDSRIRPASKEDADLIFQFLTPFFDQRQLLRRSKDEISELTTHGFVATGEPSIVGFAAVEVYSRKLAEIQCLAVCSTQRGQGIGRLLVQACVERAQEIGIMEVMAISSSDDFLHSCGFEYSLPDQKRALFYQLRPRE